MTGASFLILLAGAAAVAFVVHLYLRGEMAVRGRLLLLGLRVGVLGLIVLLLLDVRIPGEAAGEDADGGVWLLLDSDLSLLVPSDEGGTLWERALERAAEAEEAGAGLALATPGDQGPEGVDLASLRGREPGHPPGDLREGVIRLAEAGADSVILLSTFRLPEESLERIEAESPVPVRLERMGEDVRNAGVAELELPSVVPADEPIEGRVSVFGERGEAGDSIAVEISREGEVVEVLTLALPGPGETAARDVELPAVEDTGTVRYAARATLEGDVFPVDDERARWVRVGEPEGELVVLSFRPDWEPRVLLPVLRSVTGLEGEGYLAVGEDRFLPLTEDGTELPVSPEPGMLAERAERSTLLVLHGAGEERLPEWIESVSADHPRILHFPADPAGATFAGVEAGEPATGEWPVEAELPPSPLAPFLSGLPLGGLPPLTGPLPPEEPDLAGVALRARGPGDETLPALILREDEDRRRAVVLADGFWRWGSRDGVARTAYRSLWGGVADWLLAPSASPEGAEVRPVERAQPRGEPLRWHVPPARAGSELVLRAGDDGEEELFRGPLRPDEPDEPDGIARTPPVAPGVHRYEVFAPEEETVVTEGRVEVERWAGSLRTPPLDVPGRLEGRAADPDETAREGRPLRAHPAPYLLAILLLCAEWIGRRRTGLR